jgi:hypothetical protein
MRLDGLLRGGRVIAVRGAACEPARRGSGEDLADASFTQPRKRFVADPDAEAAAALTSKLLVPIFVGWGLFCYAAYRVLKSESWLSVGAVLAFAVLVARR